MLGTKTYCTVCRTPLRSCVLPAYCYRCDPRLKGHRREGGRETTIDRMNQLMEEVLTNPTVVRRKRQMYRMLAEGRFGNTINQYSSVKEWQASGEDRLYPYWGVRTKTPGGPCRLNCPAGEVADTVASFSPHPPNISVMISSVGNVTFLGELMDAAGGLVLTGKEHPPRVHDWRPEMRQPTTWTGVAVPLTLRKHLNPSSHADLMELLVQYPGHVYEFSCLDVNYGTVPGRNTIIWEVRVADGTYEEPSWRIGI